jgi:hypothetical protein
MKASVSIIVTDDHGKMIGVYQGARFQIRTGAESLAIAESFLDAKAKSPYADKPEQTILNYRHD